MATMIPFDVSIFKTTGEEKVYNFLKLVAKPDNQFISWYSPDTEGKEPDFLLFGHFLGIVVLEVKDWAIGQIFEASQYEFLVKKGNDKKSYTNPMRQAKSYNDELRNKIEKDGVLVQKDSPHTGRSKIPVNHGLIFSNILKQSFIDKKLDKVIDIEKVFFWDDLQPYSDIVCDKSGGCFRRAIQEKFPPLFQCQISTKEMFYLKQLINPIVRVNDLRRDNSDVFNKRMNDLKVLDNNQEAIARQLDGGHRLLRGSSGTGKSIILVNKAAYLKKYNPSIKKILILCYNLTLSNYLRRLVFEAGVPVGEGDVEVYGFYEFCGHILKEKIDHNIHDEGYYQAILEQAMEEAELQRILYDAILIDEGQDFTNAMLSFTKQLLNPKTDNFTLVIDENQNIYKRKQSWKQVGFNFAGRRTMVLKYAYRSTVELNRFAKNFLNQSENVLNSQMEIFPGYGEFHGPAPLLTKFTNLNEILNYIVKEIKKLKFSEGIPLNQVSIIYASKYFSDPNRPEIIEATTKALSSNGLFYYWISQDARSKMAYDVTAESITLTSIHSIKGFDHSCVFLLGLDMMNSDRWNESQVDMLTYVAITRARDQLYIPFLENTNLIKKLYKCQFKI